MFWQAKSKCEETNTAFNIKNFGFHSESIGHPYIRAVGVKWAVPISITWGPSSEFRKLNEIKEIFYE